MKPRRTLINVIANEKIGLGHVYNILTILPYFSKDEILIVMNNENNLGKNKFHNENTLIVLCGSNIDMKNWVKLTKNI